MLVYETEFRLFKQQYCQEMLPNAIKFSRIAMLQCLHLKQGV